MTLATPVKLAFVLAAIILLESECVLAPLQVVPDMPNSMLLLLLEAGCL